MAASPLQFRSRNLSAAPATAPATPVMAGLLALRGRDHAIVVGVEPVKALQRTRLELLGGDVALLAEHASATHALAAPAMADVAAHEAVAARSITIARGKARPMGGAHLLAGDAAIAVGVDAIEHRIHPLGPALFAALLRLHGREAAVAVEIEPAKALLRALRRLGPRHIRGGRGRSCVRREGSGHRGLSCGLGDRHTACGDQSHAGEDGELLLHLCVPFGENVDEARMFFNCRTFLSAAQEICLTLSPLVGRPSTNRASIASNRFDIL